MIHNTMRLAKFHRYLSVSRYKSLSAPICKSNQFHKNLIPLASLNYSSGSYSVSSKTQAFDSPQTFHLQSYDSSLDRRVISSHVLLKRYCHNLGNNEKEVYQNDDGFSLNVGGHEIRPISRKKLVYEVVRLIKSGNDLKSQLDMFSVRFSVACVSEIFEVLNREKVSGMQFFNWIRNSLPRVRTNSDICSLVICNCGKLKDDSLMLQLMHDFNCERIALNRMAFGFIPIYAENKAATLNSVTGVVNLLNKVGGSCRTTGVSGLIDMFSILGCYEMAKLVIELTEKKVSYYKILIEHKCRKCDFEGAKHVIDEMTRVGCALDISIYNYVLSSLCKYRKTEEAYILFQELTQNNCAPDPLTFEIFIYHFFKLGKLDSALEFLNEMVSISLQPRNTTHAAFIKYYFSLQQYEEAYKYVVDSGVMHVTSINVNYSLLADLHQKNGNIIAAQNIICELLIKGRIPNSAVYMRLFKRLHNSGRSDLANDMKNRFISLRQSSM